MLTSETKRRIDACRDVLVGKLPLPTDQVELITLALIYKFMDDLDEDSVELGGKRSFFVKDLAKYRWRNLLPQTVSAEERVALFSEGVEALGHPKKAAHLPGLFRDIFRNAFLKFRDGRILTMFLSEVNGFAYSHSEELGNAFEYLLQCMGTQGENGQFRTPRHIIDFMVACLDPRPGDRILDPACGTGGFLVSAFKHILATHTDRHGRDGQGGQPMPGGLLSHEQRQQVYRNLAGYDITDLMVKLSKVNLFLHGFPDPAIHIYDTLSNDARWHEKADLILANPPFMTPKGGVTPHTKFRIAAKKAEVLFTDYIAEHLNADGRGGVIVPNGIVATTQNAYVKLRRFLVEDSLVAVVSLPAGVFKPYSGVKTSILLLDKKLARQTKEILFLKITADGFDLGDKRNPIAANDLPEAERVVKLWLAGKLNANVETPLAWKAVEKKELLANAPVPLSAERYLGGVVSDSSEFTLVPVGRFMKPSVKTIDPRNTPDEVFELWSIPAFDAGRPEVLRGREIGSQKKVVMPRDILLSRIIPHIRRAWVVRDNPEARRQVASTEWIVFGGEEVVPEFLRAVLVSDVFHKAFMQTIAGVGGSLSRANPAAVADILIPLPPLEEQRRIVAEIEGYQKVLDGARQILAGYKPQLDINPEWETVKLEDVTDADCSLSYGIVQPGHELPGGLPIVRPVDLTTRVIGLSGLKRIAPKLADGYRRSTLQGGELLLCVRGTTGVVSIAAPELAGANVTRGIVPIRFNRSLMLPEFGFYAICSEPVQIQIRAKTYGAALQQINIRDLRELSLPLPPLPEQRRLVAELDAEAAQMEAVGALLPRFEAKIQRVLDRVWGNVPEATA